MSHEAKNWKKIKYAHGVFVSDVGLFMCIILILQLRNGLREVKQVQTAT